MLRIGLLVVACAVLVGCKDKAKDGGTAAGSAVAGSGSGDGSAAAAAAIDAAVAVAPDGGNDAGATAAATFPTLISEKGVGPIEATTSPDKVPSMFPGLKSDEVEQQETEDTKADWFPFSKDGKLVVKVLVDYMMNSKGVSRVIVDGPMFATAKGIKVGSTGTELAAAHADTTCTYEKFEGDTEKTLWCQAKSAPQLTFYFDAKGFKGKAGKTKLDATATLTIKQIMWSAPEPKDK